MSEQEPRHEHEPVVIRDKRRFDPVTGEPRHAALEPDRATSDEETIPKADALLLEERTRDLQRVQAEFANYRKRVERDRVALGEAAVGGALLGMLPILDDIDRARAHGDLTGAFKAVAEGLEAALSKLGLAAFGEPGDPFDPAIQEAVMHDESPEVSAPTATTVLRRGYKHGDRLLRPAMVGVSDPQSSSVDDSAPQAEADLHAEGDT